MEFCEWSSITEKRLSSRVSRGISRRNKRTTGTKLSNRYIQTRLNLQRSGFTINVKGKACTSLDILWLL